MGRRIVIIEDEEDIVELLRYNFRKEGFEVESFSRGKEGLESLQRKPPDVVLLDILLSDHDGIEICSRLRAVVRDLTTRPAASRPDSSARRRASRRSNSPACRSERTYQQGPAVPLPHRQGEARR